MKPMKLQLHSLARPALMAQLWFLGTAAVSGQPPDESAARLIRFLSYQSDRPGRSEFLLGLVSCGHVEEDRAAAISLVGLGVTALPSLEQAIRSFEAVGARSPFAPNSAWLFYSYARIKGADAFPDIHRMTNNPRMSFLQPGLDGAASISLGLTSYVSGARLPTRVFFCNRQEEPRDSLDQLILAWERDDRALLLASLGPGAKEALNKLLQGNTWAGLRAQFLSNKRADSMAMGYRFEISGPWSAPSETLQENKSEPEVPYDTFSPNLNLETRLTDEMGVDCGRQRVEFTRMGNGRAYLVNNSDFRKVLASLSTCLLSRRRTP